MSWFEEQIKERKLNDDEVFSQAFVDLTGAVLGKEYIAKFRDKSIQTKDAIDEILKYYHAKGREIPKKITELPDQLEYLLAPYGIMRRVVRLEKGWHNDAFGAMIGRIKDSGSIIALIPTGMKGYSYLDPSTGKRIKITSKNEGLIDIDAIAFYNAFPQRKIGLNDLVAYMMKMITAADVAWIIIATLVLTLTGMLSPKIVNILFNNIASSNSIRLLIATGILYVCVTISTQMFTVCKNIFTERISNKISVSVEAATMMRILSLPAGFFRNYSSGELNTYMTQVSSLCTSLVDAIFSLGITSIFSLIYLGQIFNYAPTLVKPSIFVIGITVVFSIICAFISISHSKRQIKLSAKENGLCFSFITGIQKIKLAGAEKRAFSRWAKACADTSEVVYKPPKIITLNPVIILAFSLVGTIILYYMAIKGQVTVAEYYAFSVAYGMVSSAFNALVGVTLTVAQIKPFIDTARPILDAEPEISEGKQSVTRLAGAIELDNVSFKYKDDMPNVIDNLSMRIKPGEYVAIVGETGCGKSTLIRLLLGFEKPNRGSIYYDKKDMNGLDLKSLRQNIGVVTQDGKLFQGDIFSNIVISDASLTLDDAWEAAELAGIADDIRMMPMGMNTIISEGQGGISGGQKQRLMIARAIAPKPKILMFDEATSALDNITQKKVSESLDGLKCTRIVIAHRLSTIKQCDRIVMLGGGKIIESGTYDELIKLNGRFAELVERQRID